MEERERERRSEGAVVPRWREAPHTFSPRVTREQRDVAAADDPAVHVRRRRRLRRRRRASHSPAYAFLSSVRLAPILVSVAPPREYGVLPTLRRRCICVHIHARGHARHRVTHIHRHTRRAQNGESPSRSLVWGRGWSWLSPRRRASLSLLFSFSSVFAPVPLLRPSFHLPFPALDFGISPSTGD